MNRKLEKSLDRKVCDISGLLLVSLHVLSCVLEYVQNQYRSSRPEVFCKKVGLRNFAKFTGKQLCQSFFLNKVAGLKKETLAQVFSWEFCEISKNTFFTEHLWWQNTSVARTVQVTSKCGDIHVPLHYFLTHWMRAPPLPPMPPPHRPIIKFPKFTVI